MHAARQYWGILLAGLVLFGMPAYADEPIGYVMTAAGDVHVKQGDQTAAATVGTPIRIGAVLSTGANGSMGITLKDNTMMSFGPNTELTVDEYLFAPADGNLKLTAHLTRGTLNFISGVIAKLKPEAVALHTPTGTIGVRGTHFVVKVTE